MDKKRKSKKDIKSISIDNVKDYLENPNKYVFPFIINEKSGKTRTIITYNDTYGKTLRAVHELIAKAFQENFSERNDHSFAYHKGIRCYNALEDHLNSNYFIKLDIHHFFESITLDRFLSVYKSHFNKVWQEKLRYLFYLDSLSIGFVSSPMISDFFMKKFDTAIEEYLINHEELHYSRYSDDILISSTSVDNDESLENLFKFIVEQLQLLGLTINEEKTKRMKLDYASHNSLSFLGLNLSKKDDGTNKVTISKRYILFLLYLINKQKNYQNHCAPLDNEIKSRVAYLAYNSEISYQRFQKKHINLYGEPYHFVPKQLEHREVSQVIEELPNFDEYKSIFTFDVHSKVSGLKTSGYQIKNGVTLTKYLVTDKAEEVVIPDYVDVIGDRAFYNAKVKRVVLGKNAKVISSLAFAYSTVEEIVFNKSLRFIGEGSFKQCFYLKKVDLPPQVKIIESEAFQGGGIQEINLPKELTIIRHDAFAFTKIEKIALPNTLELIESCAFRNCTSLKEIDLSNTAINSMGVEVFYNCVNLKEIRLPNTLATIEGGLFKDCSLLQEIVIPDGVGYINPNAFAGCSSLRAIKIANGINYFISDDHQSIINKNGELVFTLSESVPQGVTSIGKGLFSGSDIKSIVIPEGVTVIKDNAFSDCLLLKDIKLPSTLTAIGENAFAGCISLKEITLPDGIKVLSNGLFKGCLRLEKVHMSSSVSEFGNNCFENDRALKIDLPNGLVSIGEYAFKNCTSITDLFIPSKVQKIKKNAFIGVSKNLTSLKVDQNNLYYTSGKDDNILILSKKGHVVLGCKNSKFTQGIRSIGKYAFAYIDSLEKVVLPDTVHTIYDYAFAYCKNLKSVDLKFVSKICNSAFAKDKNLVDIALPGSITEIQNNAFLECGIKEIKLPNSIKTLSANAFANCVDVESIYIPTTFSGEIQVFLSTCSTKLNKIEIAEDNVAYTTYNQNLIATREAEYSASTLLLASNSTSFIPQDIKKIHIKAFSYVRGLKEITIPSGINDVASLAFNNCLDLEKVIFEGENTIIGRAAFANNPNLKEVKLPEKMESISDSLFAGCPALSKLVIPSEVKNIGSFAFAKSGIERIDIPRQITTISVSTFAECHNLKEVNFLCDNLISIESSAFKDCENLEKISLPNSVTRILNSAFENTGLKEITLPKDLDAIAFSLFAGAKNLVKVNFNNKITAIQSHAFKSTAIKEIVIPNNVETFGEGVFLNCLDLEKVTLPNGLQKIDNSLFKGCVNLKEIELPESVTEIGESAFEGCINLEKINFPEGLEIITSKAFALCEKLNVPAFNKNLKVIADNAFYNVKTIKNLILPSSLEVFDNSAFANCDIESIQVLPKVNGSTFYSMDDNAMRIRLEKEQLDSIILGCKNSVINEGVSRILPYAFNNIKELEKIELPSSLSIINNHAFERCANIRTIKLNDELTTFGQSGLFKLEFDELHISKKLVDASFALDAKFNSISVDKDNPQHSDFGIGVLATTDGKVILTTPKSALPVEGITELSAFAYNNTSFKKVVLPNTLTYLSGFNGCDDINELYIPASTRYISNFASGTIIKKIIIDSNNPFFVTDKNHKIITSVDGKTLYYLGVEKEIPEGIREISCSLVNEKLTSLHYPSTIRNTKLLTNHNYLTDISVAKDHPTLICKDNALYNAFDKGLVFAIDGDKIPEEVKRLDRFFIKNAKTIKIGKNINFIRGQEFRSLSEVENIIVDKDNKVFDSRNNCNCLIHSKSNDVLVIGKNGVVPEDCLVNASTIDFSKEPKISSPERIYANGYSNVSSYAWQRQYQLSKTIKPASSLLSIDISDDDMPF